MKALAWIAFFALAWGSVPTGTGIAAEEQTGPYQTIANWGSTDTIDSQGYRLVKSSSHQTTPQKTINKVSYRGYDINDVQHLPSTSPSDSLAPPAPVARTPVVQKRLPREIIDISPGSVSCDASCGGSCSTCTSCSTGCGTSCCCEQPFRLFNLCGLQRRQIKIGGWVEQGVSSVDKLTNDRYNGPVTFNDRDSEYQMNQLWLYAERQVCRSGCGWDIGGRFDFLYGTDARFIQSVDGLEANWNQTERFYQAALPQFYLDVAYNSWMLRVGHFFTPIGYEVAQATGNFFYSHAYTTQYGEPFTHTGFLLKRKLGNRLEISGGVERGPDRFDDNDDGLDTVGFLGGVTWNLADDVELAYAINAYEEGHGIGGMTHSIVAKLKLTDSLDYVFQHDYGQTTGSEVDTEWYGINQYLLYKINTRWSAGLRLEWFRDDDGSRVRGLGDGNLLSAGGFSGDFYEITAGLNWRPHANITVRPEVRWDWFDDDNVAGTPRPYNGGDSDSQFMFGCDVIVTF